MGAEKRTVRSAAAASKGRARIVTMACRMDGSWARFNRNGWPNCMSHSPQRLVTCEPNLSFEPNPVRAASPHHPVDHHVREHLGLIVTVSALFLGRSVHHIFPPRSWLTPPGHRSPRPGPPASG